MPPGRAPAGGGRGLRPLRRRTGSSRNWSPPTLDVGDARDDAVAESEPEPRGGDRDELDWGLCEDLGEALDRVCCGCDDGEREPSDEYCEWLDRDRDRDRDRDCGRELPVL